MQSLEPLKTRAKDDQGRTNWIYSTDEGSDFYKRKQVLDLQLSVTLAKNIKRKDPFFALLNREIIEALTQPLYHANKYAIHATTFELIPLSKTVNAADFC